MVSVLLRFGPGQFYPCLRGTTETAARNHCLNAREATVINKDKHTVRIHHNWCWLYHHNETKRDKNHVHLYIHNVMNCTCLTKLKYISSRCRILHNPCSPLSYLMCNTISRRGGIICGPSAKINHRGKMIGHRGEIIISLYYAYWRT